MCHLFESLIKQLAVVQKYGISYTISDNNDSM